MAEIQGLAYNDDQVEFVSLENGVIDGSLLIYGDLTVEGDLNEPVYENGVRIVTFHDGTDEEIEAMLEAHYRGEINVEDYWNIGDTRVIHLNAIESPNKTSYKKPWPEQDITIVIVDFNRHALWEAINGIRSEAAITVQTREVLNDTVRGFIEEGCVYTDLEDHENASSYVWETLPLRDWLNSYFIDCLPTWIQNNIKYIDNKRLVTNGNEDENPNNYLQNGSFRDCIFLPSLSEIKFANEPYEGYLSGYYDNNYNPEGEQLKYFKQDLTVASTRIKYGNNNGKSNGYPCYWLTGSISSIQTSNTSELNWCVISNQGVLSTALNDMPYGIAPAFCL